MHAGRLARLDARGAFTLLAQLRSTGPLTIPPGATGQLVDILARSGVDPADLPEDLQFEVVAHSPTPIAQVRADDRGGTPSLLATVSFDYEGVTVDPGAGTTSFDRERRRLVRRDLAFEDQALKRLTRARVHAAMGLRLRAPRAEHLAGAAAGRGPHARR